MYKNCRKNSLTIFHTIGFTFWVYEIKRVSWCPTNKGNSVLKNETNKNAKFMRTMKTHKCFKDGFGLVAYSYGRMKPHP